MLVSLLLSVVKVSAPVLLTAALTGAGQGPAGMRPPAAPQGAAKAHAAPPAAHLLRLTNDSLAGQPFGQEPTVRELLGTGGRVVSRRPYRNLYEANQIDTLLLVRHQGNVFEFYRAPEKDLLRDAVVTNFQPAYGRRLRRRLAAAHQPGPGTTANVRIGDTERTNYVSVVYQRGQLSTVHVEPYAE